MDRRGFLQTVGALGAVSTVMAPDARAEEPRKPLKLDLHTHYYPEAYFQKIRDTPGEFSFDKDPTGRTIIKYRGARFFGIQPPMTDPVRRLADMDRVGIDVEVVSLSTPNVFFAEANRRKLCILLHPMLPANPEAYGEYVLGPIIGFPCDTTLAVARMCYDGLLKDFPDIRWIIAHLGGAVPYLMERMDNGFRDFAECKVKIDQLPSTYLKRLYYDTVTFSPYVLNMARDLVGTDHLVMGSDYPHLLGSIERAVTSIEALAIPQVEKERIFSGTALSILNNV